MRVRPRRRGTATLALVLFLLIAAAAVVWVFVLVRSRDGEQGGPATSTTTVTPSGGAIPSVGGVIPEQYGSEAATAGAGPTDAEALDRLEAYRSQDQATVEGLVGRWVAQVSAKREGLEVGGVVYDLPHVLADHELHRAAHGAVLLWSGDYVFLNADYWISVVPTAYDDPDQALDWCRSQGFDRDNCFAKLLTHDAAIEPAATTRYLE